MKGNNKICYYFLKVSFNENREFIVEYFLEFSRSKVERFTIKISFKLIGDNAKIIVR